MRALRCATLVAALALAGCAAAPPPAPAPPVPAPVPEPAPAAAPPAQPAPPPPAPRRPITIAAVGDLMLGTDYPEPRLPPQDGATLLAAAAPLLSSADIAFGNLEGVMMDGGEPFKVCNDPSRCYLFRTPARYVHHLVAAGFDVLSLANNHARDFGESGRSETMRVLRDAGLRHSGRDGDVASWQVADSRVALIAFAPNPGSHSLLDIPAAASRVAALAADHDIVLVSVHGGAEGEDALHVRPGNETYLGEDRGDLMAFAHALIDAGADAVLGHGPHVPRGLELYRGRLVAYSLGNFATYLGISVSGLKGMAPLLSLQVDADGRFVSGHIVSMRQQRPGGPMPDRSQEAATLMRALSEADFGPNAPVFDTDGHFTAPDVNEK